MPPKKVAIQTDASGSVAVTAQQKVRVWMQVGVSIALLVMGFMVLIDPRWLPHFDESVKKLAAGWIGAVIGYWLS